MAKRSKIIKTRQQQRLTGVNWGILVWSATLAGLITGAAIKSLPNMPWDTGGRCLSKVSLRMR